MKIRLKGDRVIWLLVMMMAMISVLAVYSSSTYRANVIGIPKTEIFLEQVKFAIIGFIFLFLCYLVPLRWYRFLSFIIFGGTVLMLLMTFIPGIQDVKNGAIRGIKFLGRTIQPSECVKVGLVMYLARALEIWEDSLYTFKDFALKLLLPIVAVCAIVMVNSFSSAILFGGISFLILFVMKVDWKYLAVSIAGAVAIVILLFGIYNAFYAEKYESGAEVGAVGKFFNRFGTAQGRIADFISESKDKEISEETLSKEEKKIIEDENRQSENAKIAISTGGILGKGPGKSTQRYSLSEAYSDFIFAFIVEEYGLVGGLIVIMLYLIFLFRCIRIAGKCETTFSNTLIIGLAFLVSIQAFLHIMVNVRLIPITGHTLPLISQGGTAYLVFSGAMGVILSVSTQVEKQEEAREAALEELRRENMQESMENKSEEEYED